MNIIYGIILFSQDFNKLPYDSPECQDLFLNLLKSHNSYSNKINYIQDILKTEKCSSKTEIENLKTMIYLRKNYNIYLGDDIINKIKNNKETTTLDNMIIINSVFQYKQFDYINIKKQLTWSNKLYYNYNKILNKL